MPQKKDCSELKPRRVAPRACRADWFTRVSNANQILIYIHCVLCLQEWEDGKAPGQSPRDYSRLEIGWTTPGFQIWCVRHNCNVLHMDFEGRKHPANVSAKRPRPWKIKSIA